MPERMQFQQQNRNFGLYKGAKSSGYICPSCEPDEAVKYSVSMGMKPSR